MLGVAEFEKGIGALLLLLLSMEVQHGAVDVVEQLRIVLDGVATTEEHDDFLLLLLHSPEEGEEKDKPLIGVAKNVALFKPIDGAELLPLFDVDVQRAGPKRYPGQILCDGVSQTLFTTACPTWAETYQLWLSG